MPIVYTVDSARRRIASTVDGVLGAADVTRFIDDLRRAGALEYAVLTDARGLRPPFVSPEEIWQIAATLSALKEEVRFGPRAIVISDQSPLSLARMFEILVSAFVPVKTFHEAAAAEAWLAEFEQPGISLAAPT